MRIIADLHIHSPYSRATSPKLTPPYLERWAQIKGLDLIGTGDCTHPVWLKELREQLDNAEEGLYTLQSTVRKAFDGGFTESNVFPKPFEPERVPRFVLTGEISTIYTKEQKTRKIHHLVILPDFKSAAAFQTKLERIGNINSDGRPILGIDSRDLLAMLLDTDERAALIPAHIWTPWFSVLGAKSGFDSIDECYRDLAPFITAIETGLSSNPPMNWSLTSLDRFRIISNSDAHSPEKLGREATVFDFEEDLSFSALTGALGLDNKAEPKKLGRLVETIEFFPQEGKYHYDGHRKCGVYLSPEETLAAKGLCPVCHKPLTHGVMRRVLELADRPVDETAPYTAAATETNQRPYCSLIPLKELLGEILETGPGSKKVEIAYNTLIPKTNELALLRDMPLPGIERLQCPNVSGELLAQGVARMREGTVTIIPGYDGEYGIIRAFPPKEERREPKETLFPQEYNPKSSVRNRRQQTIEFKREVKETNPQSVKPFTPAPDQEKAIMYQGNRALIIAGPGAGKTATLAACIAYLIQQGTDPKAVAALSFTVKAAVELRERIVKTAGTAAVGVTAATFHSLCASILREGHEIVNVAPDFMILNNDERDILLNKINKRGLGNYIETRKRFLLLPEERDLQGLGIPEELIALAETLGMPEAKPEYEQAYKEYRDRLCGGGLLDFDDLIVETVRLLAGNPELLRYYRERFRVLFVDEYQDINFAQYVLIRLLVPNKDNLSKEQSLWVIGDPNQSIYGFRGSDKRFIDRFLQDYPQAAYFQLTQSFRCAEPIIDAAGQLMHTRLKGTASQVNLFRTEYSGEKAEAEGIARRIVQLIGGTSFLAFDSGLVAGQGGSETELELTELGSCAILLRTLRLAAPFVSALQRYGIPCKIPGEKPWWEEDPISSLLKLLRDTLSQKAGLPVTADPGTPAEAVKAAWEQFSQRGIPKPPRLGEEIIRDALERLLDMAALYDDLAALLDDLAVSDEPGGVALNREGVQIITIHASKGLEFEHVFVPALEEGLLPFTLYGPKPIPEERLEEEKRLLYVAMTRAKVGLYLSYAKTRMFQGRKLENPKSRFFDVLETVVPVYQEQKRKEQKKDSQLDLWTNQN
ncbi:MAG: UvrD-helicase domain-containing protein [Treponema sp.]|nr:UvrD-helicase domain-containing protein [Treponema sp.]